MVRRARRGRRELHHFELIYADDPQAIQVLHQFKVRPTAGQSLALLIVDHVDVVKHCIPCSRFSGIGKPFPRTQGTARCLGRFVCAKVAEDMNSPVLGIVKRDVTVKEMEQTDISIGGGAMISVSWDDEGPGPIILEDLMTCEAGCPSCVQGCA